MSAEDFFQRPILPYAHAGPRTQARAAGPSPKRICTSLPASRCTTSIHGSCAATGTGVAGSADGSAAKDGCTVLALTAIYLLLF